MGDAICLVLPLVSARRETLSTYGSKVSPPLLPRRVCDGVLACTLGILSLPSPQAGLHLFPVGGAYMTLSSGTVNPVLGGGGNSDLNRSTPALFYSCWDPGDEVMKVLCLAGGKPELG